MEGRMIQYQYWINTGDILVYSYNLTSYIYLKLLWFFWCSFTLNFILLNRSNSEPEVGKMGSSDITWHLLPWGLSRTYEPPGTNYTFSVPPAWLFVNCDTSLTGQVFHQRSMESQMMKYQYWINTGDTLVFSYNLASYIYLKLLWFIWCSFSLNFIHLNTSNS